MTGSLLSSSNDDPNLQMLNASPSFIERRQSSSAAVACLMDCPFIEPEQSSTKTVSEA